MSTPIRSDQIDSLWWQSRLKDIGQIAENGADIGQCLQVILTTPYGSVPHQPEFGSKTWDYLDLPIPRATPYLVRETLVAIARFETRIKVERVTIEANGIASVKVATTWTLKGSSDRQTTEVVLSG